MKWTCVKCVKCMADYVVVSAIRYGNHKENEFDASKRLFKKVEQVRCASVTDTATINRGFYIDGRYRFSVDKRGVCDGHCRKEKKK